MKYFIANESFSSKHFCDSPLSLEKKAGRYCTQWKELLEKKKYPHISILGDLEKS